MTNFYEYLSRVKFFKKIYRFYAYVKDSFNTLRGRHKGWPKTLEEYNVFWSDKKCLKKMYYSEERIYFYKKIANLVEGHPVDILDIGCGDGYFLNILAQKFKKGCNYFGIDYSAEAIEKSKKLISGGNFSVVDLENSKLYFDRKFDVIFILETLEHIKNPEKVLHEAFELLKKDGCLIITVPDGAIDNWEGHTNFWTISGFKILLSEYKFKKIYNLDKVTLIAIIKNNEK
jgi:2-polyprenyl-6-hydroxyphenyl methylase/3-demethylubiquinone-9 3-methyltransferase